MHELLTKPAFELARLIRTKQVSPREVVDVHIARIEEVNPLLNAVVVCTFEEARSEARRAEQRLAHTTAEELPALFGVPCTIKELISVKGCAYTAGVVARRDVVGREDAPLVARMRQAGAIILGLTNVAEAGLWLETYNCVYGRTNNAYSTAHISGGSSGGEGAIIGAAGSPIGIGADVGGSIRNPCFFNGIAGHKPSGGLLPSTGHWPPAEGRRGRYCVSGPMGRTVGDMIRVMEVLSPEDDPYRDRDRPRFAPVSCDPRGVTVYWFDDNGLAATAPEMKDAIERTVLALEARGFKTAYFRPKQIHRSAEIWGARLSETEDPSVKELLGNGAPIDVLSAWLDMARGRSAHALVSLVMATFESVANLTPARTAKLSAMAEEIREELETRLGPRGVLVCPPYPRAAPPHLAPMLSPLAFTYCGLFNVLELPSTAVPVGFNDAGLPLGVQVVGRRFDDALTLFVAKQIEEVFGGWRPIERPRVDQRAPISEAIMRSATRWRSSR